MRHDYSIVVYIDPNMPGEVVYGNFRLGYKPLAIKISEGNSFKQMDFIKRIKGETGVDPGSITYFDNLSKDQAEKIRERMIEAIGTVEQHTGPLINLKRKVISSANLPDKKKGYWLGKKFSESHRKNMSAARKGISRDTPWMMGNDFRALCWVVIEPTTGRRQFIHNLNSFCKEKELDQAALWHTSTGARRHHLGWSVVRGSWL